MLQIFTRAKLKLTYVFYKKKTNDSELNQNKAKFKVRKSTKKLKILTRSFFTLSYFNLPLLFIVKNQRFKGNC